MKIKLIVDKKKIMNVKSFLSSMFLLATLSLCAQNGNDIGTSQAKSKIRYALIFEGGLTTASPISVCGEFVTMHGISIKNQHIVALAGGIAGGLTKQYGKEGKADLFYIPIYAHYRYYVNPNKGFSPIVTASLGGLISLPKEQPFHIGMEYDETDESVFTEYGKGIYSEIAAGFKAGSFFLIGGITFTPMYTTVVQPEERNYINHEYDWTGTMRDVIYTHTINVSRNKWITPLGLCLKIGITF
jgi:hypothetical protein